MFYRPSVRRPFNGFYSSFFGHGLRERCPLSHAYDRGTTTLANKRTKDERTLVVSESDLKDMYIYSLVSSSSLFFFLFSFLAYPARARNFPPLFTGAGEREAHREESFEAAAAAAAALCVVGWGLQSTRVGRSWSTSVARLPSLREDSTSTHLSLIHI